MFVEFTNCDGNPLYVRKDLVAAVSVWNKKTHLVLSIDEVDYEVKETPEQVLRALKGKDNEKVSIACDHKRRIPNRKRRPLRSGDNEGESLESSDREGRLSPR